MGKLTSHQSSSPREIDQELNQATQLRQIYIQGLPQVAMPRKQEYSTPTAARGSNLMFAKNMESVFALNADIGKLGNKRPTINRHLIKDATNSSRESLISKDSAPYEDEQ